MTLTTVRAQRQENESRLRQLALDIRRVSNQLNQSGRNTQLSQQYNTQLSRYTDEQRQRQQYAEQLNARESDLRVAPAPAPRPVTPPRQPDSSVAFVGGTVLTAASIFIFTWMINLHLDPRAYMVLFLIALAAGALTWVVARSS